MSYSGTPSRRPQSQSESPETTKSEVETPITNEDNFLESAIQKGKELLKIETKESASGLRDIVGEQFGGITDELGEKYNKIKSTHETASKEAEGMINKYAPESIKKKGKQIAFVAGFLGFFSNTWSSILKFVKKISSFLGINQSKEEDEKKSEIIQNIKGKIASSTTTSSLTGVLKDIKKHEGTLSDKQLFECTELGQEKLVTLQKRETTQYAQKKKEINLSKKGINKSSSTSEIVTTSENIKEYDFSLRHIGPRELYWVYPEICEKYGIVPGSEEMKFFKSVLRDYQKQDNRTAFMLRSFENFDEIMQSGASDKQKCERLGYPDSHISIFKAIYEIFKGFTSDTQNSRINKGSGMIDILSEVSPSLQIIASIGKKINGLNTMELKKLLIPGKAGEFWQEIIHDQFSYSEEKADEYLDSPGMHTLRLYLKGYIDHKTVNEKSMKHFFKFLDHSKYRNIPGIKVKKGEESLATPKEIANALDGLRRRLQDKNSAERIVLQKFCEVSERDDLNIEFTEKVNEYFDNGDALTYWETIQIYQFLFMETNGANLDTLKKREIKDMNTGSCIGLQLKVMDILFQKDAVSGNKMRNEIVNNGAKHLPEAARNTFDAISINALDKVGALIKVEWQKVLDFVDGLEDTNPKQYYLIVTIFWSFVLQNIASQGIAGKDITLLLQTKFPRWKQIASTNPLKAVFYGGKLQHEVAKQFNVGDKGAEEIIKNSKITIGSIIKRSLINLAPGVILHHYSSSAQLHVSHTTNILNSWETELSDKQLRDLLKLEDNQKTSKCIEYVRHRLRTRAATIPDIVDFHKHLLGVLEGKIKIPTNFESQLEKDQSIDKKVIKKAEKTLTELEKQLENIENEQGEAKESALKKIKEILIDKVGIDMPTRLAIESSKQPEKTLKSLTGMIIEDTKKEIDIYNSDGDSTVLANSVFTKARMANEKNQGVNIKRGRK